MDANREDLKVREREWGWRGIRKLQRVREMIWGDVRERERDKMTRTS